MEAARSFWPNYYKKVGLDAKADLRFNTGILVLNYEAHRGLLRRIVESYDRNAFDYEQTYLNFELVQNNLYHVIDHRFNTDVMTEILKYYPFLFFTDDEFEMVKGNDCYIDIAKLCLLTLYDNSHFLHFAGTRWPAKLLTEVLPKFANRDFLVESLRIFRDRVRNPT